MSAWRNQRGATLLETVVAVGLFALTAATMGDFMRQQIRTGSVNLNYSTAYALAAEEFEDIRAMQYDDIASRSSSQSQGKVTFAVNTVSARRKTNRRFGLIMPIATNWPPP